MSRARILIVEDERDLADSLALNLREEGYDVTLARRGDEGYQTATHESFDLILLDLMLPGMDGRDICRLLRRRSAVPIMMLTAKGREVDKVLGFEMGADDYLAKPFGMMELIARVKALLRRVQSTEMDLRDEIIQIGRIIVDVGRHTVSKDGQPVELRPKEFDLLRALMSNAGRVLTRDRLLEIVWGEDRYLDRGTLDVHIRWLREKVEDDPARPRLIITVRGVGYKFAEDAA
jgi:two-component system, OmpR family, response regulator RegX3